MYKNKAKQREANKRASKKYRTKQGMTELNKGMTGKPSADGQGMTAGIMNTAEDQTATSKPVLTTDTQGMTPAIINALLDSKKRAMLEFVSQEIQRKGLPGENLFYGVNGFDFTEIPELLRITANLV